MSCLRDGAILLGHHNHDAKCRPAKGSRVHDLGSNLVFHGESQPSLPKPTSRLRQKRSCESSRAS